MDNDERINVTNNDDLLKAYANLLDDIRRMIKQASDKQSARNNEQFLAEVMTGHCPGCGTNQIKDCRKVEGIIDISVGLCMRCGYLWCLECGRALVGGVHCDHWDICIKCHGLDDCDIDLIECSKLRENV